MKPTDRVDQLRVDTQNQGEGAAADSWNNIGDAHAGALGKESNSFHHVYLLPLCGKAPGNSLAVGLAPGRQEVLRKSARNCKMGKTISSHKDPMKPAESLGDPYDEYLEDEWGYAYAAWSGFTQQELRRHDELLHGDIALLEALEEDDLDDLQRFAVARAWRRQGNLENYLLWGLRVAYSKAEHPALVYPDVVARLTLDLARAADTERARALLLNYRERWTELKVEAQHLEINIALLAGDSEQAQTLYESLMTELQDEGALPALELAEDALASAQEALAIQWLEDARQRALDTKDSALLVDIELFARELAAELEPDEMVEE